MFYQFSTYSFEALLNSSSGELHDVLKKALYRTIDLDLRAGNNKFTRSHLWLLTLDQLQRISQKYPDYTEILRNKKILDNEEKCLLKEPQYSISFPILIEKEYYPERGFEFPHPEHLDSSILTTETWVQDLATGFYSATGYLGQWFDAVKEAKRKPSELNGIVSIVQKDIGLMSESLILHGIALTGFWQDGKNIIDIIPNDAQFSLAQAVLISPESQKDISKQSAKLSDVLKNNNFSESFGSERIVYVARVKI